MTGSASRLHHLRLPAKLRPAHGQGLVEGTMAIVMITMIFCMLIGFLINVFMITQWSGKANVVASETAKVVASDKYWLGMQRPDYDPAATRSKAQLVAATLCKSLGLPQPTAFQFSESSDNTGDYSTVTFKLSHLPLPVKISGLFPKLFSVEAKGVAFQPKQAVYAAMQMNAPTQQAGVYDVVYLPVYGFFRGYGQNPNFYDLRNGYNAVAPLPGEFGKLGHVSPKYYRGLPLPAPTQWDPRLITDSTGNPTLAGLSQ